MLGQIRALYPYPNNGIEEYTISGSQAKKSTPVPHPPPPPPSRLGEISRASEDSGKTGKNVRACMNTLQIFACSIHVHLQAYETGGVVL